MGVTASYHARCSLTFLEEGAYSERYEAVTYGSESHSGVCMQAVLIRH